MLSDNDMFVRNQTRNYNHVLRLARASRDIANRFPEEIAISLLADNFKTLLSAMLITVHASKSCGYTVLMQY